MRNLFKKISVILIAVIAASFTVGAFADAAGNGQSNEKTILLMFDYNSTGGQNTFSYSIYSQQINNGNAVTVGPNYAPQQYPFKIKQNQTAPNINAYVFPVGALSHVIGKQV